MENIVRETRDQERKERDYVKLAYLYGSDELYDEKDIVREIEEYSKSPDRKLPPSVPGANTLAARLILSKLEESLFEAAEKNIEDLIGANDTVHCYGLHSCKGQSDCATTEHQCKGNNACKGHGFKAMKAGECLSKGGTIGDLG